jgi:hypothetical protein
MLDAANTLMFNRLTVQFAQKAVYASELHEIQSLVDQELNRTNVW